MCSLMSCCISCLLDLEDRNSSENQPVHVVNLDIKDNHDSATIGAINLLKLAKKMEEAEDLDDQIEELIEGFETETGQTLLHAVAFY